MKGMWEKMTDGGGCQPFDRWITDSLAGELTSEQQAELDAHLAACATCRAEFTTRRNAWALTVQSLRVDAAPAPLSDAARKAIEDATTTDLPQGPAKPARSYNLTFVWMEIAASVIIVILLFMMLPSLSLGRKSQPAEYLGRDELYLKAYTPPASAGPGAAMPEPPSGEMMRDMDAEGLDVLADNIDVRVREVRRYGGSARQEAKSDKGIGVGAGEGGLDPTEIDTSFQPRFKAQDADSLRLERSSHESGDERQGLLRPGAAAAEPQSNAETAVFGDVAGNEESKADAPRRRSVVTAAKPGQADEKADRLALTAPAAPPPPMAPMTTPPAAAKSRSAEMADGEGAPETESTWNAVSGTRTTGSTSSLLAKNKQPQPAEAGKLRSAEAEKDRVLGEKFVRLEMNYRKIKKELNDIKEPGTADIEKSSLVPKDAPLEDRYAALEHDYQEVKKELDGMLNSADSAPMPPPLSETTFEVDAAMWRRLGGSDSEIRNYLADKGIALNAEDSVSYDAAAGKLILRHGPADRKAIEDVIESIRTTAEEQRELRHGLPFIKTGINPTSTFSIDVDTASYALARRYLRQGQRPPPERVRPEEFINAFDYAYRSPENALFGMYLEAAPDPFRPERTLFRIGVQGRRLGADVNRPSQFTLLIDTSGSMGRRDRIGLAQRSVSLLLDQLRPQDRIAILTCGYRSQVLVPFTPAAQRKIIERLVAGLRPQGEANLERGIVAAYGYALDNFQAGAGNRVILFTDGIAGFGARDADTILAQVETARRQGVTNTVVGFGGDGDDDLLEALANRGDGSYVFLNDESDARTLFEKEFAARFHEIARDVKIQVEFNPDLVAAYRQIGYQNRQLSKADFRNDQVDAGEVGAGQSVTALYELQPVAMALLQGDALRIRQPLATVRIRYRRSDNLEVEEREFYLFPENLRKRFDEAEPSFQLAAAVAEFAEHLRFPDVPGIASPTAIYDHIQRLYGTAYRNQPNVHEFMTLVGRVR